MSPLLLERAALLPAWSLVVVWGIVSQVRKCTQLMHSSRSTMFPAQSHQPARKHRWMPSEDEGCGKGDTRMRRRHRLPPLRVKSYIRWASADGEPAARATLYLSWQCSIPPLPLSQTACSGKLIADNTSGEDSVPLEAWCCRYLYLAALTPIVPWGGFQPYQPPADGARTPAGTLWSWYPKETHIELVQLILGVSSLQLLWFLSLVASQCLAETGGEQSVSSLLCRHRSVASTDL